MPAQPRAARQRASVPASNAPAYARQCHMGKVRRLVLDARVRVEQERTTRSSHTSASLKSLFFRGLVKHLRVSDAHVNLKPWNPTRADKSCWLDSGDCVPHGLYAASCTRVLLRPPYAGAKYTLSDNRGLSAMGESPFDGRFCPCLQVSPLKAVGPQRRSAGTASSAGGTSGSREPPAV